jgi:REP element-mobilizing transposase RayT
MSLITKYNSNVFLNENIHVFHVTCVLHDSRQSERMFQLKIENKAKMWLSFDEEIKLTEIIKEIVKEKNILIWAYNICGDHVHMILVCEKEELTKIVQCLKSMSSRAFNIWKGLTIVNHRDSGACSTVKTHRQTQKHFWARKFNRKEIITEEQLHNTFQYIQLNRLKHGLSENKKLNQIIHGTTQSFYK